MRTLGPYKFTEVGSDEENCGCGGDYCNLLQTGDRITFQIPSGDLCAEFLAGCENLTAACITEQAIESDFTYTQNADSICFDLLAGSGTGEIEVDDLLLYGTYGSFAVSQQYKVCFKLSNNMVPDDLFSIRINIGAFTYESDPVYQGNGLFCAYLVTALGGSGTGTYGIVFKGGDDSVVLCVESLTLCDSEDVAIQLIQNGEVTNEMFPAEAVNGNIVVDFPISGEVGTGCFNIRATIGAVVFESNCIKIATTHSCTLLLRWRNDNNAFGYDYGNPDYDNYLRIKARLKNPFWPTEVGTYLQSDNQNQLTNAQQSETVKLVTGAPNAATFGEPEYVLRSLASALIHSLFTVDGVTYRFTGTEFSPNWRNSSDLAHFEIDLINQDYDGINRYCG